MAHIIFSAAALGICAFTLQLLALKLAKGRYVLNFIAPLGRDCKIFCVNG